MKIERTDAPKKTSKKSFIWELSPEAIKMGINSTTRYREQKPKLKKDIKSASKKYQAWKDKEELDEEDRPMFFKTPNRRIQPIAQAESDEEHQRNIKQRILQSAPPPSQAKKAQKKESYNKGIFSRSFKKRGASVDPESETANKHMPPTTHSEAKIIGSERMPRAYSPVQAVEPISALPELEESPCYSNPTDNYCTDFSNESVDSLNQSYLFNYQAPTDYFPALLAPVGPLGCSPNPVGLLAFSCDGLGTQFQPQSYDQQLPVL